MSTPKSAFSESLKYDGNGLIPAIIQDVDNQEILMVGYMNQEAVDRTLESRRVTYWSRSRQKYWLKGETSGHFQHVVEIRTDCDQDALLIKVQQEGVACHEGYRSCFFRVLSPEGEMEVVESREVDPNEVYGR